MKISTLFTLVLAIVWTNAFAQGKLDKSQYDLVLFDDFNSATLNWDNLRGFQLETNPTWYPNTTRTGTGTPSTIWKVMTHVFHPVATPDAPASTSQYSASNVLITNGVLHLTAEKLPAGSPSPEGKLYTGGGIELTADIDAQDGPCDWNDWDWMHGLQFGMVEIRCKLPAGSTSAYPAFWLLNPDTEIDVIDNGSHDPSRVLSSGVLDWRRNNKFKFGKYLPREWTCGGKSHKNVANGSHDLSEDYNVYTVVWTPDKVTFFLNGREQYTVPTGPVATTGLKVQTDYSSPLSQSHAAPDCKRWRMINGKIEHELNPNHHDGYRSTATIRIDISTTDSVDASFTSGSMDIDYIKVYKPKVGSALSPVNYVNSTEYRNFEVRSPYSLEWVSPVPGSIAPNMANANEVFFRGTNDLLYRSERVTGRPANYQWGTAAVDAHQADHSDWIVSGDVVFNEAHGHVTYRGSDNRIQLYKSYQNPDQSWSYIHDYVDSSPTASTEPLNVPHGMAIAKNGDIYYIGGDFKIQRYHLSSTGQWVHDWVGNYNYPGNDSALGDLVLEEPSNGVVIYYKAWDNRIQYFYNYAGSYYHAYTDYSHANSTVAAQPGSLTVVGLSGNIFYIGGDGDLHRYYFANNMWNHEALAVSAATLAATLPTSLMQIPAAGASAHKPHPQGTIAWDETQNQAVYTGNDGRLYRIYNTSANNSSPGTWTVGWIDDYFNTGAFLNLVPATPSSPATFQTISSVIAGPSGNIFYGGYNNQFRYFALDTAPYINPDCADYAMPVRRPSTALATPKASSLLLNVFPNPTTGMVSVKVEGATKEKWSYSLSNLLGQKVLEHTGIGSSFDIDLGNLTTGIYLLKLQNGDQVSTTRLIKQ